MSQVSWAAARDISFRIDAEFYRPELIENERRIRACSPCRRLNDLRQAKRPITNGIRGPEIAATDFRMLRLQDIDGLWLDSTRSLRISESQFRANRRAWCVPGDVLVAIGGYIGVVGKVRDEAPQTMGQHSALLAFDDSKIDPDYALAFFSSGFGARMLQRYVSGGVQAGINLEDLREISIPLPSVEVQRGIGDLIRQAERLRDLKRFHLQSVEASIERLIMGDAIGPRLAEVDLGVPRDSVQATTWVRPDALAQRIDASYYQERFVQLASLVRGVGRVTSLGKLAPNMCNGPHGGITYVTKKDGVRYIRAKNVSEMTVDDDDPVWISNSDHQQHIRGEVLPGDLLITITGANIGAVGVVPESIQRANIIQSLAKARIESEDDPYYICAFLASPYGQLLIRRESVNTAREGINFDYLSAVPVPLPERTKQSKFRIHMKSAELFGRKSIALVERAKSWVEALVEGSLDEANLFRETLECKAWLDAIADGDSDSGRRS